MIEEKIAEAVFELARDMSYLAAGMVLGLGLGLIIMWIEKERP